MLVVLPPIFVADTKIIYGYNFVVPLIKLHTLRPATLLEGDSNVDVFL